MSPGDEGIQIDLVATLDADALSLELLGGFQAQASPNRILERVPDDALAFYSGQGLASLCRSALNSLMSVPDASEQLQDFEDVVELRLDEDHLSWLSGEHAIVAAEACSREDVPICGFELLEVDDQLAAEDRLGELAEVLERGGGLTFEKEIVNGEDVKVLVDPWSEETVTGYGFDDGYWSSAYRPKAQNGEQRRASTPSPMKIPSGPCAATGYLYVNLEDATDLLYDSMDDYDQDAHDLEVRPYIEPIRALGLAASPPDLDKGVSHIILFVHIP